jgi:hypothetical protein
LAGTIFGLGLSQQTDARGVPLIGALLYIYAANTSTPSTIYSNFALTATHPWPLAADSAGRIPAFWLADGDYRARLTTSAGVEVFDEQSITAIGSSSSGSSSVSQDTTTLHQTGDFLWQPVSGTRSGWVRANGRTIGSGASSATERANSDTQSLFEWFWNNFSDSFCAVSGGRGASATADFNANKTIATLDMRSKSILGLDDMGNTSLSITGSSSIAATAIGASTYTIVTANLPSTNLSLASLTASVGTSITNGTSVNRNLAVGGGDARASGGGGNYIEDSDISFGTTTLSLASGAVTFGGSIPLGGSGTDIDILTPSRVGTFYVKL